MKWKKRKEETEVAHPTEKYFRRIGAKKTMLNLGFQGGEVDVIAYSKTDNVFHIAECKLPMSQVQVGQTFGQILTYISILSNRGRKLFNKLYDEGWFKLEETEWFLDQKELSVYFYVSFPADVVKRHRDLISALIRHLGGKVGVIQVRHGRATRVKAAKRVSIQTHKRYKRKEFLEAVRHDLADISGLKWCLEHERALQGWPVHQKIHYEVWLKRRQRDSGQQTVEAALHVELGRKGRKRLKRIYKALKDNHSRIGRTLPRVQIQKWGEHWMKAYEHLELDLKEGVFTEAHVDAVSKKLRRYIDTLNPILDDIDWGKLRKPRSRRRS